MAAWYCDLAALFGMALTVCEPVAAPADALPEDDPGAWEYRPPPEPEPEPEPAPEIAPTPAAVPVFPPIEIYRSPDPPPAPAPEFEAPPPPDPARMGAAAAYAARMRSPVAWSPVSPESGLSLSVRVSPTADGLAAALAGPLAPPALAARAEPAYEEAAAVSSLPVDNSRIVTTDRYISGILEGGVNSQLSGGEAGQEVVIQVNRDVFGYHGRNVLIPKGSRLVCGFRSPKQGESRLGVRCARVLLGGHRAEIYQAGAAGYDAQGRLGVAGEVDNRFWERYGTAFVLAGISAAVRASSAAVDDDSDDSDAAEKGAEELGERFGEITAAVLERTVNLAPIVTLSQGTRVTIRPARDWYVRRVGRADAG